MTDAPPGGLPAGPRDALIREQTERLGEQEWRLAAQAEQIAAAERARSRNSGKQPGSPGASMTWEVPDRTEDHYPEGSCCCGRDLADAGDLGVARSFQQEEIPAAAAERVRHDLHEARCACGRMHVHVPVERCRHLIADVPQADEHRMFPFVTMSCRASTRYHGPAG